MAKLTSEQRKNLPEDVFGLPDERSYPMPDAEHVSSAIAYFGSCPTSKRKTLAANINRLAKKYGVKVNLSDHSPFRPYADKEILDEAADKVNEQAIPNDVRQMVIRQSACHGEERYRTKIDKAMDIAIRNRAGQYLDGKYMTSPTRMDSTQII